VTFGPILPFVPWPPSVLRLLQQSARPRPLNVWLEIADAQRIVIDPRRALPLMAIPVDHYAAFILSFPISSSPDRSFTLRLDELVRGEEVLPVVQVDFGPATGWIWEALGG
jgi:hypothetical protein